MTVQLRYECKHGNTKIINVEFKDKTIQRFFPCYCPVTEEDKL